MREAAIKALTYCSTAYKEGFVPPGAVNWNDADDNNAFHSKQIAMDLDGTNVNAASTSTLPTTTPCESPRK